MELKNMHVLLLVLICVLLGVVGQLSMKKGLGSTGALKLGDMISAKIFSVIFQKYVFVGITLYVISLMVWLVVLSQEELSFVYPLIGIGYIITAVLSWFFFGESLTLIRLFGILLISSGVYLIVLKI